MHKKGVILMFILIFITGLVIGTGFGVFISTNKPGSTVETVVRNLGDHEPIVFTGDSVKDLMAMVSQPLGQKYKVSSVSFGDDGILEVSILEDLAAADLKFIKAIVTEGFKAVYSDESLRMIQLVVKYKSNLVEYEITK